MDLNLAQAKVKRRTIKASCTRCRHQFDALNASTTTVVELEMRMKTFANFWSTYDEVQTCIEMLEEAEAETPEDKEELASKHSEERNAFETNYYSMMSKYSQAIDQVSGNRLRSTASTSGSANSEPAIAENRMKLRAMAVPTFSGSYDQWRSYRDAFKSLVHNNPALSRIQKFHHLADSLKGLAAETLHSIDICDDNYEQA